MKKAKRKLAAFAVMLVLGSAHTFAQLPVELNVGIYDPVPSIPDLGKSPVNVPVITQDGYEIDFGSSHPAYTLYILDEGVVVYSVAVSSATTSVILPSWLSGEYELQLHPDDSNYYFYGYIEL